MKNLAHTEGEVSKARPLHPGKAPKAKSALSRISNLGSATSRRTESDQHTKKKNSMASLKTTKTRLAQFLTPEFTHVNEDVKNWV